MKILNIIAVLFVFSILISFTKAHGEITSSSTGKVLTNITARATGGGSHFDGKVDNDVITAEEAVIWTERVRVEFRKRVHWEG